MLPNEDDRRSGLDFKQLLAREILRGEQLRTSLLAGIFAFGALVFLALYVLSFRGGAPFPLMAPVYATVLMAYQIGAGYVIRRRFRTDRVVPQGLWYLNAFLEVTILTVGIFLLQVFVYSDPVNSLLGSPVLGYCLFITLSTLLVDFGVSVFTGAVAALEYCGIALYTLYFVDHQSTLDPVYLAFPIYLGIACVLLMVGLGAGFVARELRQRMIRTFESRWDRDRMATASELKSKFLANMSHEIRTPLNSILGYGQILASDESLSPSQSRSVRAIQSSGAHLLELINEVLDLSKIEAGRQEVQTAVFSLHGMIDDLEATFATRCSAKDLSFSVTLDGVFGAVVGDEQKLRQVLVNLLGNAVKFTSRGGVRLEVVAERGRTLIAVTDTGPGIPRARQARLFEPFLQDDAGRRHGGTGLGLAIASRLVRLMGGELEVESTPGAGARFSFTIALPEASGKTSDQVSKSRSRVRLAPGHAVAALVVDDVAENREILGWMLERIGVTVTQAASGAEALETLARGLPDIVFTDIRMPALSGLQMMQRIVAEHGRDHLKFVAVSASALAHERQEYLDAGFDAFLEKPVQMERLTACLVEVTGVEVAVTNVGGGEERRRSPRPWPAVALPAEVLASLEEAAREHDLTKLKRALDAVDALGPAERELAARLRELGRHYDMDALSNALERLTHE